MGVIYQKKIKIRLKATSITFLKNSPKCVKI